MARIATGPSIAPPPLVPPPVVSAPVPPPSVLVGQEEESRRAHDAEAVSEDAEACVEGGEEDIPFDLSSNAFLRELKQAVERRSLRNVDVRDPIVLPEVAVSRPRVAVAQVGGESDDELKIR